MCLGCNSHNAQSMACRLDCLKAGIYCGKETAKSEMGELRGW